MHPATMDAGDGGDVRHVPSNNDAAKVVGVTEYHETSKGHQEIKLPSAQTNNKSEAAVTLCNERARLALKSFQLALDTGAVCLTAPEHVFLRSSDRDRQQLIDTEAVAQALSAATTSLETLSMLCNKSEDTTKIKSSGVSGAQMNGHLALIRRGLSMATSMVKQQQSQRTAEERARLSFRVLVETDLPCPSHMCFSLGAKTTLECGHVVCADCKKQNKGCPVCETDCPSLPPMVPKDPLPHKKQQQCAATVAQTLLRRRERRKSSKARS